MFNNLEENKITEINSSIKKISKIWSSINKSIPSWDFNTLKTSMEDFDKKLITANKEWEIFKNTIIENIDNNSKKVGDKEYITDLDISLREQKLPLIGEFPEYLIPPFKLAINKESFEIKLFFGRKFEKTTIMKPKEIAIWVQNKYKKITNKKFDPSIFMKELIEAYKWGNKNIYREKEVLWGKAVKLLEIYSILTIKRSTKLDYPKQLYMYELAQLKENSEMVYEDYRFELGFAKNPTDAIVIVDSKGVESRVSSLTIYKEGK
ncbi:hypothetical protein KKB84_01240 [bacterium]|nr:hypothetical protein [bacterium]MBU2600277.1 hypothetical protein [bacterium]